MNVAKMRRFVREFDPDAVICTHYVAADVLAHMRRRGRLRAPVTVVITDYDIHTMWVQAGVDRYCVATEEMAHALHAKGIGEAAVQVTGIPIMPVFAESYPERPVMRRRLGLNPDRVTVMVSAGGFGMVKLDRVVKILSEEIREAQFLAMAGGNRSLLESVRRVGESCDGRVAPFPFVDNMHELMAASDLIVTKPGGLTSSECLAMGLPMVIVQPIPGQEERNADFLLESGVAVKANSLAQLAFKVRRLLDQPERLESMRATARAVARPNAAADIAEAVVSGGVEQG